MPSRVLPRRLILSLGATAALALAGCATPLPKPETYAASIRTVGLVSALPADAQVVRIGLTVFNNSNRTIPMAGEPSRIALDDIAARLGRAQPGWRLQRLDPPPPRQPVTNASLGALAKQAGVDAVVAILETRPENGGGKGVGVYVDALPGLKPSVGPHAVIAIRLVDQAGNRISEGWSLSEGYKVPETGFTGDLAELDNPQVLARVQDALRGALRWSIDAALTRMGF